MGDAIKESKTESDSNLSKGLSLDQVQASLLKYGPNKLPEAQLPGPLALFLRQFLSPFIYILLTAALVSFVLNQIANGVFIMAVLLLNAVIGTAQEYSAQKSAAALRNLVKGKAQVMREGIVQTVDAESLVPGDWVLLTSGDKVPADILLHQSQDLGADESMLTGESLAVDKTVNLAPCDDLPLSQRSGQCFAGTMITRGRAQGIVTATGLNTELGKIAHELSRDDISEPPLMIRIRRFTYQTAGAIIVAIFMLLGIMYIEGGYDTTGMALMAIGLAVSAIPEGLPAALTVALSIGMRRMAEKHVIIRRLVAVEALGSCTFICSDKTGTLTVNELTIRQLILPNGKIVHVTGEGVAPGGEVERISDHHELDHDLITLCTTGVLANESYLDYAGDPWASNGDIVDVAFLVLAKKMGLSVSQLQGHHVQVDLIPYESENAYSGSFNHHPVDTHTNAIALHVKGSPEKILSMCNSMIINGERQPLNRSLVEQQYTQVASQGYRIIALAKRDASDVNAEQLTDLTFLGMVAMIDPVRPEAKSAVQKCRSGGIHVAMVTGDHPATAKAIALELGLCEPKDNVVTGEDIRQCPPREFDQLIAPCRVFARIEPQQKQAIVASFMKQGHFVAVTGDGVNDAPAMKQSHVGVAMGKRGTDVAKETAQLIITDDNFSSIVNGIEQGRIVYNNIRKVIALLIATGFSALLLFFLSVSAGLPMPLTAIQLLWLNLVANGLQDVALAFEPKEGGELSQLPRSPNEPIFEKHIIEHVLVIGGAMGLLAFGVFAWLNHMNFPIDESQNLTLLLMVLFGNIHALSARSETKSLFSMRPWANPFLIMAVPVAQLVHIGCMYVPGLNTVLGIQPVTLSEWGWLAIIALLLLCIEETHKYWLRRRQRA